MNTSPWSDGDPGHGSSSIDSSTSVGACPAQNGKGTAPWILRSRPDRFLPQPKGAASDRTGSRHLPERVGEVHTLFSTGHCTHAQENPQTRALDRPFGNTDLPCPWLYRCGRHCLESAGASGSGTRSSGTSGLSRHTHKADNEGQEALEHGCSPRKERKFAPVSTTSTEPRSGSISAEPHAKRRRARPPVGRTGLRRKPRRVDLHVW